MVPAALVALVGVVGQDQERSKEQEGEKAQEELVLGGHETPDVAKANAPSRIDVPTRVVPTRDELSTLKRGA